MPQSRAAALKALLDDLASTEIGLNDDDDDAEPQGIIDIMAGSMTGIRNPKAHGNLNPDNSKALHLIALASLLMHKIDE